MKKVVVGIIARNRHGKKEYLLMSSRKDYGVYTGLYYPPGGRVEEGEEEKDALVREFKEELNVKIRPTRKIATTENDILDELVSWWECEIVEGELKIMDAIITDAQFFTRQQMQRKNLWPATKMFFERYVFKESLR